IVHRDIKPDNIMINSRGIVKLADLGLARTTAKVDTVTLDGTAIGTPQYMSPEQVRAEPDLDTRADIYALGATLYHMITGEFPFDGPTPAAIIAKQLSDPVPAAPGVSRATNDLIQVMMAKDRGERPQTPAQLLHMIKDALAGKVTFRPSQSARTRPMAARPSHAVHRHVHAKKGANPLVWVGIAVAAVAAVGIFLATRGGDKPVVDTEAKVNVVQGNQGSRKVVVTPKDDLAPAIAKLRSQVKSLSASGKFGEALAAIDAFAKKHPGVEGDLRDEVLAPADARYAELVQAADVALEGKDYAKARAALAPAASFGIPALATQAKAKLAEIDSREKQAAQWVKWDAIKAEAAKLTAAGKFDEAVQALAAAKALPLDNVAELIATETAAIDAARQKAADAVAAAYAAESDKVWALFKERKYAEADALLSKLADKKGGAAYQADLEAAKLLKEFWGRVEAWVVARKGKLVSIAGASGNVATVENGVVTLNQGDASFTRRVDQLAWVQALAYAGLKADARSNLLKGVFLLAEQEKLDDAETALAAAGDGPHAAALRGRLASVRKVGDAVVAAKGPAGQWLRLFDGTTLDGWRGVSGGTFSKHGKVGVAKGCILLARGKPVTGIACSRSIPKENYELTLEAMRQKHGEELCSIVFPLGASRCQLVVGGWARRPGEGKIALSRVDGRSGSDNMTTRRFPIEDGRWYKIHLAVRGAMVIVSVDGVRQIDFPWQAHEVSLQGSHQVIPTPLGICAWNVSTAIRNVAIRRLPTEEKGTWKDLLSEKYRSQWKMVTDFGEGNEGGRGAIKDGRAVLEVKSGRVGMSWADSFPTRDYEVVFEAAQIAGSRFGSVVFAVGESHGVWVMGSGTTMGMGVLDGKGYNHKQNPTTRRIRYERGRWYKFRLRVTHDRVEAWRDDEQVADLAGAARRLTPDKRGTTLKPFGFNTLDSTLGIRNLRLRSLTPEAETRVETLKPGPWRSLFDGKSLKGWRPIREGKAYEGAGNVAVKEGAILLAPGQPHTGIQWIGTFPRSGYELTYEAAKFDGPYQFGCPIFPVGDSHCELILGAGAGHNIVGLSDVDGKWAGENLTKTHMKFDHKRWYPVRVRVTDEMVEAWVGDRQVVTLRLAGHALTLDAPPGGGLAIRGYKNTTAVRKLRVRRIADEPDAPVEALEPGQWRTLFDGKTLKGWRKLSEGIFAKPGEVLVKSGALVLSKAERTGVVWEGGGVPEQSYEVELDAMRVSGELTFCHIHFPMGETQCILAVGGWDGTVVGLDEVDGKDGDRNPTTKHIRFEKRRWYRVRLRVTPERVQAWIEHKSVIDIPTAGHTFSVSSTLAVVRPFGLSTYGTTGAFRNIRIRSLGE
ncbi:DUF1080 domain-containing protein, partial [bacterium]|nr:DUF1080 domain-containing protein [bacterium]